ncbi:MAG: hypothetical protein R3C02_07835 [Planctomycetaceae bacterium]
MTPETTDRMKTANATQMLVDKLSTAEPSAIVKAIASASVETSETAMGECVSKAPELEGNLDTAGWQTFELIRKLPEEHQSTAKAILADLQKALASDEHVLELAPALRSAQAQAMRLLEKLVEVKHKDEIENEDEQKEEEEGSTTTVVEEVQSKTSRCRLPRKCSQA